MNESYTTITQHEGNLHKNYNPCNFCVIFVHFGVIFAKPNLKSPKSPCPAPGRSQIHIQKFSEHLRNASRRFQAGPDSPQTCANLAEQVASSSQQISGRNFQPVPVPKKGHHTRSEDSKRSPLKDHTSLILHVLMFCLSLLVFACRLVLIFDNLANLHSDPFAVTRSSSPTQPRSYM